MPVFITLKLASQGFVDVNASRINYMQLVDGKTMIAVGTAALFVKEHPDLITKMIREAVVGA